MKTKRKPRSSVSDTQLFNLFKEVCSDEATCEAAVKDAKRAFHMIRQDAVFNNNDFDWEDGL